MKAKYIVIEGTEGLGKTTQIQKLVEYLESKGKKVLVTKEPGTHHLGLTMDLRGIMLDAKHEPEMTVRAREFVSQAIRSIHLEKLVYPAMDKYDYIIQDRGVLSGLAYGISCGNSIEFLDSLADSIIDKTKTKSHYDLYDLVIFFSGDSAKGLERAKGAKQEFESGDAMESKGNDFMKDVESNFYSLLKKFKSSIVEVSFMENVEEGIDKTFKNVVKSIEDNGLI